MFGNGKGELMDKKDYKKSEEFKEILQKMGFKWSEVDKNEKFNR